MSQENKPQKQGPNKHFWYSIMPLLITLVAIVLINWVWPDAAVEPPPTRLSPTAVSAQPINPPATITRSPILPATLLPSPSPTQTPRPEQASSSTILLLGPPAESSVAANGRLTFYWTYSEPILPGQQFVLILRQNDTVVSTFPIAETNLGDSFQLMINFDDLAITPGTAVWQLHLKWNDEQQPLLISEERLIFLLPE